jgi:hypothetical protein
VKVSVVDTNVAVVANGKTPQAGPDCVLTCITGLNNIVAEGQIFLDHGGLILEEYRRHLSPSGQPGPGDAFFKWLWNNQGNPRRCRWVVITPVAGSGFAEFPEDPELAGFDASDRKFVAVVLASDQHPPINNASDTDWWHYREVLKRHGVEVLFLCPELMKREI